MSLTQATIIEGLIAEYAAFAGLTSALSLRQWDTGTRCPGWRVRDVAGHVLGNVADTLGRTIGSRTPDEQARALRHLDPTTSARDLREGAGRLRPMLAALDARTWQRPSPVPGRSVGEGVLSLWYDTFVHGDDIRAALGIPSERGPGLAAAVEWLRLSLGRRRWGPARLVLDGLGEFPIGDGGPTLRGDPVCFVLVASGRADPAEFGVDERVNIYR